MKKLILIALSVMVFFGCNNQKEKVENTNKTVTDVQENKEPSALSIEIQFNTDQSDEFQFLFSQIELPSNKEGVFIIKENYYLLIAILFVII